MAEEMVCTCDEFRPNAEKMNSIFGLAHRHGVKYDGAAAVYCPWCGEKLRDGKIELCVADAPSIEATQ